MSIALEQVKSSLKALLDQGENLTLGQKKLLELCIKQLEEHEA